MAMPAFWRQSIRARIVVSTLILTALSVSLVGWLLLAQTREGLLEDRRDAVLAEVADETTDANDRLNAAIGTDVDASAQRRELIEPIIQRGVSRGFSVVMAGPVGAGPISDGGAEFTPGLDTSSVPADLEDHFSAEAPSAWTYTEIRTTGDVEPLREPGIVVGSQVVLPADGGTYTLYFLFPLTTEAETLQLVARGLLVASALLIALAAGIAYLTARQVVTPVRMARRVAERLAAGALHERMRVSGEDDLARLAVSFNQMAASLQEQIRQLEELSRLQRRFVSDVSHELRTPLTTVRMASEVLHDSRSDFDAPAARAAELMQTELDRFEELLVDLLEISRYDAGAVVLDAEDTDLVEVVELVVAATRPLARAKGLDVVVEAPAEPCIAEVDIRRVQRILRNLITNAIDHTDEGVVMVRVRGDSHAAAIAVRDHGVGLGPGEAAMVFNRFWRADPARARTHGGTGLGLSISLEDARLHGGWLQAWGRRDAGAQFVLTIPRHVGARLRTSPIALVPEDVEEVVR
ncbi:MAG: MtrAB system histidine kinase MtrB [Nocardioides sp.]